MRCQTVRNTIRALLAAGFLATSQNAELQASWKDRIPPFKGSCFVHDLHWDYAYASSSRLSNERNPDALASDSTAMGDNELCIQAAKQFEIQMQVEAIIDSLKTLPRRASQVGTRLFLAGFQARTVILDSAKQSPLQFALWMKVHDAIPVTTIVSQDYDDFSNDWNCGDFSLAEPQSTAVRLPQRKGGNVFVFVLERERSSDPLHFIADSISESLCDPLEYATAASSWQVGVDPVCPELQGPNSTMSWRDSVMLPSVCCPLDQDEEAYCTGTTIATSTLNAADRPPVLEAEYEDYDTTRLEDWQPIEDVIQTQVAVQNEAGTVGEFSSVYAEEEKYERDVSSNASSATPWIDAVGFHGWASQVGKRIALGQLVPRVFEADRPRAQFSIEDLISTKSRTQIFDAFRNSLVPDVPWFEKPTPAFELSTDSMDETITSAPLENTPPVEVHVPVEATLADAVPVDLADHPRADREQTNLFSKHIANRIRSVGMLLIDFASQLERRADQVEIAKGADQSVR